MALPPELIRIKRRRGEEPVDSLFIHTENQQKRRRTTAYNYLIQRVTDEDVAAEASPHSPEKHGLTAQSPRRAVSSYARSEVPVVRATLPGEELLSGRQRVGTSLKDQKSGDSNGAAASVPDALEGEGGTPPALFQTGASSSTKPRDLSVITRRFHLKRTASTFPASRPPASGIQKRKKGQRVDIAVFVERSREPKTHDGQLPVGHSGADSYASLEVRSDGVPVAQLNHARPRKRPGTGTRAVVAKKGADHGGRQDLHTSSAASSAPPDPSDAQPRDRASLQLAEELQRATLQPSSATFQQALDAATRLHFRPSSHPRLTPRAPARTLRDQQTFVPETLAGADSDLPPAPPTPTSTPTPHAKAKFPPLDFTNPYPYGPETQLGKDAAGVDSGAANDNDNHSANDDDDDDDDDEADYVYDTYIRRPTDPAASVDRRKIGVIVITQEDETLWETYGVDEGEDQDWDSAEEDENAEDFHANDYPDEDLDSDDEFGRAAYGYRRDASDAEEYDERTGSWSDEGAHPWDRRNPWALRVREVEDSDEELSD